VKTLDDHQAREQNAEEKVGTALDRHKIQKLRSSRRTTFRKAQIGRPRVKGGDREASDLQSCRLHKHPTTRLALRSAQADCGLVQQAL
jgi:hypothetical protein